ncbi:MAG: hypothetical protein LBC79_02690 [Deltaproteobacteria bacterium]|jgi:uncharacterized protein YceK|nr:hypothetical protein [Deltaproteobacteria bacterium]
MRKVMLALAVVAVYVALAGCASKHMETATIGQNEDALADNQSAIIFFRDTSFGGAIQAPLVESRGANVEFVGIISANTKLLHKTTPGKHLFIVSGESSNMLEADLAPKKFYYVRVDPKLGFAKARFAFEPVSVADEKLQKALSGCTWVTSGATAQAWFNENQASMQSKADTSAEKGQKAILNRGDGSDMLIR